MHTAKRSVTIKLIAILLLAVMLLPIQALAVESRASAYLSGYSAYIYPAGWGKVQVWFEVDGTDYMDEIGTLEIQIYESKDNATWYWVDTFMHTDYPDMLEYNDYTYTSHIEYNGTIGRYYKAYVCVWAGKDGAGDTRYFWTNIEKATLFKG